MALIKRESIERVVDAADMVAIVSARTPLSWAVVYLPALDRLAALVRQLEPGERAWMALEEIRVGDQVLGDLVFGGAARLHSANRLLAHAALPGASGMSTWPSKAVSAGPVSQIGSPGPGQRTISGTRGPQSM